MNWVVRNQLIPGLTETMSNGPAMNLLEGNDNRDEEGVSHTRESQSKGLVDSKEAVSLSTLFTHAQMFHLADTGATCS